MSYKCGILQKRSALSHVRVLIGCSPKESVGTPEQIPPLNRPRGLEERIGKRRKEKKIRRMSKI
jgi:hypothetical protein